MVGFQVVLSVQCHVNYNFDDSLSNGLREINPELPPPHLQGHLQADQELSTASLGHNYNLCKDGNVCNSRHSVTIFHNQTLSVWQVLLSNICGPDGKWRAAMSRQGYRGLRGEVYREISSCGRPVTSLSRAGRVGATSGRSGKPLGLG